MLSHRQLYGARAAFLNGFGLDRSAFDQAIKPTEHVSRFPLTLTDGNFALQDFHGKAFALLDSDSANLAEELGTLGSLRFQAVFQPQTSLQKRVSRSKKTIIEIAVNIYGLPNLAEVVGTSLTRQGHFLQHPDVIDPGIKYENPQFLKQSASDRLEYLVHPRSLGRLSKENAISQVDKILDSLNFVDSDWEIPTSPALLTTLLR